MDDEAKSVARALVVALLASATFGAACAAYAGSLDASLAAALLPLGLVGIAVGAVPSLCIGLSLAGHSLDGRQVMVQSARGLTQAGRMLGGLSPLVLLYAATTIHKDGSFGMLGLLLVASAAFGFAGSVGTVHLIGGLFSNLSSPRAPRPLILAVSISGFVVFALCLGARLWERLAPVFFAGRHLIRGWGGG